MGSRHWIAVIAILINAGILLAMLTEPVPPSKIYVQQPVADELQQTLAIIDDIRLDLSQARDEEKRLMLRLELVGWEKKAAALMREAPGGL